MDNYRKWAFLRPNDSLVQVLACLSRNARYSYFTLPGDSIYIPTDSFTNYWSPDAFDRGVISHEFGHFLHWHSLLFIDTTGAHDDSPWEALISAGKAAQEGFACFWSAYVTGSAMHYDSRYSFHDTTWLDMENGKAGSIKGTSRFTYSSANSMGDSCIGAVAGMLWDVHDNLPGLEDFGGPQDWRRTDTIQHPDGRGDTLGAGIQEILKALLDKAEYPDRPNTINQFWHKWFTGPSQGHFKAMSDIWFEHGENRDVICCIGTRGNTDGDPQDIVDIGDLAAMIDFIFFSGSLSSCYDENNVNGETGIDISDLQSLIDYFFFDSTLLPCPAKAAISPPVMVSDN